MFTSVFYLEPPEPDSNEKDFTAIDYAFQAVTLYTKSTLGIVLQSCLVWYTSGIYLQTTYQECPKLGSDNVVLLGLYKSLS